MLKLLSIRNYVTVFVFLAFIASITAAFIAAASTSASGSVVTETKPLHEVVITDVPVLGSTVRSFFVDTIDGRTIPCIWVEGEGISCGWN